MMSLGKNTFLLIFEGESICMYRRLQSPRQFHHLWIVLAIISAILLASCSTNTSCPTCEHTYSSSRCNFRTSAYSNLSIDRKDYLPDPDGKSQLVRHQA